APRCINEDRAAMGWNWTRMEDLEIMHLEQRLQAVQRIIAQMLMIDRVVLQLVEQRDQVVRFRDEHAVWCEQFKNAVDDGVYVLDMGKAVGGGHDTRGAMRLFNCACDVGPEIVLEGRDAALVGDVSDIGWLDAKHAMPTGFEIGQQGAVIRSDIDNQIVRAEPEQGFRFGMQLRE